MFVGVFLGVVLGTGLLLVAAPWLWPDAGLKRRRPVRAGRLRARLDAGGFSAVSTAAFVAVSVLLGLVAGAAILGVTGVAAFAALAAAAGAAAPLTVVGWRTTRRIATGRQAWPDVLDHLVAAVRSGIAMPDALAALADTGPEPLRPAFRQFARSYGATGNFGVSVDELKSRLADPVADRIIETLRMAREVGGTELATVLRGLSQHLRADGAVRAELEARQSWVHNAARLGVAAPWIVLLLLCTRPEAAAAYSTSAGVLLLVCGAALSVVAYRAMISIGRLPREARWFQ
ncbi:type II secretion system F family protein [Herbiconiux sp. L3-i23]|uniref:type II secretion system F family protein n=1 Tax=Herbiconiux sp. L3-i23 TaxID=2905871 RepID=UPI002073A1DF|nr:type II secretion system F family protein [Herbiconiux sp. L3-i23]